MKPGFELVSRNDTVGKHLQSPPEQLSENRSTGDWLHLSQIDLTLQLLVSAWNVAVIKEFDSNTAHRTTYYSGRAAGRSLDELLTVM